MAGEVWGDLYFLINFSMDLLSLWISASLLHVRPRRNRMVLAAVFGGAYALLALILGFYGMTGFLFDIAACVLIALFAFYTKGNGAARVCKSALVYALVSMMMGGVLTGLYALINRLHLPFDFLEEDGISVWMFAILTVISGIVTAKGGRFFGLSQKTKSVTVKATVFGNVIELCAFVDSGNLLSDPVSGRGVILLRREKLLPLLPPSLQRVFDAKDITAALCLSPDAHRVRLIPAGSATGSGLLPAIRPDALFITEGGSTTEGDHLLSPAELRELPAEFDALISMQ